MTKTSERRAQNRLARETSPYLLQHATNPVDWYPWGPEALARAKELDRPILLSIGYAACHWCHVMERESFENAAIAARMNEHFVCIKVDREERPDLDEIYMTATMALSGGGGWPMTVFLTPEQEPFFAGTYFPPEDRYGRPGFPTLLERIAELWQDDRPSLLSQAAELTEHVRSAARPTRPLAISRDSARQAYLTLARDFDATWGGFGGAPKFPPSAALALLLRYYRSSGEPHALVMARKTLDAMKDGGMYDQLGGGFARYSVDERWLVPHFEKMLYDNAQLADVYIEAFAATGDGEYERVARETLDYVAREMQAPSGGYFSSSDADSEGEEGKYFVFRHDEVRAILGEPLAERFSLFYGVVPEGNWEGKNVLHRPYELGEAARELGISRGELEESLGEARQLMLEARAERVPPGLDDKVLVAWNGLMIRAMANGHRALSDERYLDSACRAADFVLEEMRRPDGGLMRTSRGGHTHLDAYLEDYAYLTDGLVSLYETSGIVFYLEAAKELGERMLRDFGDPSGGAFFHTAHGHEQLISRVREGHDGALPSPNAVACRALGRLAAHLDRDDLRKHALQAALAYGQQVKRHPRAFASLLGAVDFLLEPPLEIVFAGDRSDPAYGELVKAVTSLYLPNRIEAHAQGADVAEESLPPLVRGKQPVDGQPAVYLCEGFACQKPLTDPDALERALRDLEKKKLGEARSELGRGALAGRASAEGTRRLAQRSALGEAAYGELLLGTEKVSVSRLGAGGYRVGLDVAEHRAALRKALTSGVNLIDTSPTFAAGDSERLIGECLAALASEQVLARDEVVVVTKVGLAQGPDRERIEVAERAGKPFDDVTWLDDDHTLAFCLDAELLAAQLTASLERLGLEHVEVCLVQNPEHMLLRGKSQTELEGALERAFRHLESEVTRGRIGAYGVSSNTFGTAEARLDVGGLLSIAERASGGPSHFRVVELPLNLLETAGLEAVRTAAARGLSVLTNRALNAFVEGAVLRLAKPKALPGQSELPPLAAARSRVAALEAELETTLSPMLRVSGLLGKEQLFSFGGAAGDAVERAQSLEQFEHLEATVLTPLVRRRLGELDRAFAGPVSGTWQAFRNRYVEALGVWLGAARGAASEKNEKVLSSLDKRLQAGGFTAALDGPLERAPWSQRAIALVRATPGVTSVLVGMRELAQVEDALGSVRLDAPSDALGALASTQPT